MTICIIFHILVPAKIIDIFKTTSDNMNEIICQFEGYPNPLVQLFHNSKQIPEETVPVNFSPPYKGKATFSFSSMDTKASGEYKFVIENDGGRSEQSLDVKGLELGILLLLLFVWLFFFKCNNMFMVGNKDAILVGGSSLTHSFPEHPFSAP